MSDPAQYQVCSFRYLEATDNGNSRTVVGRVRWRLAPEQDVDEYMKRWEMNGYKTGLAILYNQTITELSYRGAYGGKICLGTGSQQDLNDLHSRYKTQTGYKWQAFQSPDFKSKSGDIREPRWFERRGRDTVEFEVTLTIDPKRESRQLLGAASRHRDGNFTESMTSLWVLPLPDRAPRPS